MSTLTDEQRKMIEEKKKAAQAKLAAKFSQKNNFLSTNNPPPGLSNINPQFQPNKLNRYTPLKVGLVLSPSPKAKAMRVNYNVNNEKSKITINSKPVRGTCEVTSKERFVVHVAYHQQLIEIFKTISSKSYGMFL